MGSMQRGLTLGDWLKSMRQTEGWSYRDVAKQAERHGHQVSASGVERMEKTPPLLVKKDQVEWIVDVFGVPPRSVVRMFLGAMGYGLGDSSVASIEDAILTDAQLSRHDKKLLQALVAAMRSAAREEGASWSGDPVPEESELGVAEEAIPIGEPDPHTLQAPDPQSPPAARGARPHR